MSRVIHFEIPVDDPARAIGFYKGVFGWQIGGLGGPMEYWLATTGDAGEAGINGALTRRDAPGDGVVLTIGVDDLGEATGKITEAGGKIMSHKLPVPGVGWLSTCTDTEGNTLHLMQQDPSAG
jgi:uncharacterized protein